MMPWICSSWCDSAEFGVFTNDGSQVPGHTEQLDGFTADLQRHDAEDGLHEQKSVQSKVGQLVKYVHRMGQRRHDRSAAAAQAHYNPGQHQQQHDDTGREVSRLDIRPQAAALGKEIAYIDEKAGE